MNDTVICIEPASAKAGGCVLVDMLTLSVQRGERIAIVGQNGAGKSSLLRMIAGLLQPANGRVEVLGQTLQKRAQALHDAGCRHRPDRFSKACIWYSA